MPAELAFHGLGEREGIGHMSWPRSQHVRPRFAPSTCATHLPPLGGAGATPSCGKPSRSALFGPADRFAEVAQGRAEAQLHISVTNFIAVDIRLFRALVRTLPTCSSTSERLDAVW